MPEDSRQAQPNSARDTNVVVLATPADGIAPLRAFLSHMPRLSGVAWVLAANISPENGSLIDEIADCTNGMEIHEARVPTRIEPDHIYLAPPGCSLDVRDGMVIPHDRLDYVLKVAPQTVDPGGPAQGAISIERAMEQQRLLVELGQMVAAHAAVDDLFQKAVESLRAGMNIEYAKVLELMPEGDRMLLRKGVGWKEGQVGHAYVSAGHGESQAAYALATGGPVVVEDGSMETRFRYTPFLVEHEVWSGVSVAINGSYGRKFGVLGAHSSARRKFHAEDIGFVASVAAFLSSAIMARHEETLRSDSEQRYRELAEQLEERVDERTSALRVQQERLRYLNVQILTAEEHERRRIAEGLHDDVQQLLAAAHFGLHSLMQRSQPIPLDMAEDIAEWVGEALNATRSFVFDLSPSVLYEEGFATAVGHLADEMHRRHGLIVHIHEDTPVDPVPENARVFMYSAVRELLFNVVKHAGISEANVHLLRTETEVLVTVRDGGKGINEASFRTAGGKGLRSLRERAEHFNGHLLVESGAGEGTAVTLALPVTRHEELLDVDPDSGC